MKILWIVTGLVVLYAAFQVKASTPAANAIGMPGTGCMDTLALIGVVVILVAFFVVGAMATLGGE